MWSWREMSPGLLVCTEPLCPWSLTGKQRASCGPAHFILTGVAPFPRQSPGSLHGSHSLFWWSDLKLSVFVGALTLTWVHFLFNNRPGAIQYRDGMEKEVNGGEVISDELMERCQVYPRHHVMQSSRYLQLYCELLSDIWGGKYVSWSVCLLTFPLWSCFPSFASSVPSSCCLSSFPLVILSRCIARLSVTSAPTQTRLSSTPPSSTLAPAQVQYSACFESSGCFPIPQMHSIDLPTVCMSAQSHIMTVKCSHIFSIVHWSTVCWCFVGHSDVLDYYLTCSRRMNSPFQQVTWSLSVITL